MKGIRVVTLVNHPAFRALLSRWTTSGKIIHKPSTDFDAFLEHVHSGRCSLAVIGHVPSTANLHLKRYIKQSNELQIRPHMVVLMHNYRPAQRSRALSCGADGVIELDNSEAVVDARLDAIVRRCRQYESDPVMNFPPYTLNRENLEVTFAGNKLGLSQLDFRLLEYLFIHRNESISRHTLLRTVWNLQSPENQRRVDTKISQLRKRLELDGTHGWDLQSDRHAGGYHFSQWPDMPETEVTENHSEHLRFSQATVNPLKW